jgi:hypothetical protein
LTACRGGLFTANRMRGRCPLLGHGL